MQSDKQQRHLARQAIVHNSKGHLKPVFGSPNYVSAIQCSYCNKVWILRDEMLMQNHLYDHHRIDLQTRPDPFDEP